MQKKNKEEGAGGDYAAQKDQSASSPDTTEASKGGEAEALLVAANQALQASVPRPEDGAGVGVQGEVDV